MFRYATFERFVEHTRNLSVENHKEEEMRRVYRHYEEWKVFFMENEGWILGNVELAIEPWNLIVEATLRKAGHVQVLNMKDEFAVQTELTRFKDVVDEAKGLKRQFIDGLKERFGDQDVNYPTPEGGGLLEKSIQALS
jgi:hypothetical protein